VDHLTAADLKGVELFAPLTDADLARIADWFEIQDVEPGEVLVREGSSGYAFMVLGTASAEVHHGDTLINRLGPGDFFGESAILGAGRRTATVTATSPGTVWVLFGTRFRELGLLHPDLQATVEQAFASRTS
jgi:ATP-binding cassette subfamily B protein